MRRDQKGPRRQGLGNDSLVEFNLLQIVIIHGIESNFTSWLVLDNYNHENLLWEVVVPCVYQSFVILWVFSWLAFFTYPLPLEHILKIVKLTRVSMSTMCMRARVGMHKVERGWKREGVVIFQSFIVLFSDVISFLFFINMK